MSWDLWRGCRAAGQKVDAVAGKLDTVTASGLRRAFLRGMCGVAEQYSCQGYYAVLVGEHRVAVPLFPGASSPWKNDTSFSLPGLLV